MGFRIRSVPQVQTGDRNQNQAQQNFANTLAPIVNNPIISGYIKKSVALSSGDNTISHGLGRTLVGWHIVRQRASATVYDKQDSNATPDTTLVLNASAAVTVDLYLF